MASPNTVLLLRRISLWVLMVALTYVFWKWLAVYVLPFAIALVIATVLDPMVRRLRRLGLPAQVAIWTSILGGALVAVLVMGLVFSLVVQELAHLLGMLPAYTHRFQEVSDGFVQRASELRATLGLSSSLVNAELSSGVKLLEEVLRQLLLALSKLPAGILVLVVAGVAVFFILRDGRNIEDGWERGLPESFRPRMKSLETEMILGTLAFLKAQLALVGLTAVTTMIGLAIIGSHYAVVLGLLGGLLDLIPFLGPTALIVPWASVLMMSGDGLGAVRLLVVLVVVALTRQLIEPRLVSHQTGLHPLWVLFSFYVGIQLFGPVGFLVGPISAVMLRAMASLLFAPPPTVVE